MSQSNVAITSKFYMRMENVPNMLTALRILLVPFIMITFYLGDSTLLRRIGTVLFTITCFTDFLDGYIARKLNAQSELGRMLDPIADKLIVAIIMVMLIKYRSVHELPCIIILAREIIVSGLREFLGGLGVKVLVTRLAKIKTAIQMLSIVVLMLGSQGSCVKSLDMIGGYMLWISAILTVVTGYKYFSSCMIYFK